MSTSPMTPREMAARIAELEGFVRTFADWGFPSDAYFWSLATKDEIKTAFAPVQKIQTTARELLGGEA